MLKGVGTIVNAPPAKPYLPQICGTIKWRMNNKAADIREQAADLIKHRSGDAKVRRGATRVTWASCSTNT